MAYELFVKPDAEADIAAAVVYYDEQRSGLGDEFLDRVRDVLHTLKRNPFLATTSYNDIRQTMVRPFPYVISYLVEGNRIVVIAVLHGHRDPSSWKSRADN